MIPTLGQECTQPDSRLWLIARFTTHAPALLNVFDQISLVFTGPFGPIANIKGSHFKYCLVIANQLSRFLTNCQDSLSWSHVKLKMHKLTSMSCKKEFMPIMASLKPSSSIEPAESLNLKGNQMSSLGVLCHST